MISYGERRFLYFTQLPLLSMTGETNLMARQKSDSDKSPPEPATIFESLLFVAVAGTVLAIVFLTLALSRYDWALPS